MENEILVDIQAKAIFALMAKLGLTEITFTDADVKAAPTLLGIEGYEVELIYDFSPSEGTLKLKMEEPE
jgi:hypothetical protein